MRNLAVLDEAIARAVSDDRGEGVDDSLAVAVACRREDVVLVAEGEAAEDDVLDVLA